MQIINVRKLNQQNILAEILVWNSFQFAGGFDAESMRAFEELRSRMQATTQAAGDHDKPEA